MKPCAYWRPCCCARCDEGGMHCWNCGEPQEAHTNGEHMALPPVPVEDGNETVRVPVETMSQVVWGGES